METFKAWKGVKMIICGKFKSTILMFAFAVLTSAVFVSALDTCRIYAAMPVNNEVKTTEDQIAAFEEDEEAGFDEDFTADVSALLYAASYQPPAYFSERQKEPVKLHPWMRVIPVALLVILALGTSRFFKRHRQKITVQSVEWRCE